MKIKYRPEIDGLRAIAVISVVIYHAQINYAGYSIFAGGYLGVDIFFVISGYLITSIIFKELKLRKNYEKPSEKKAREKKESVKRFKKLMRKKKFD